MCLFKIFSRKSFENLRTINKIFLIILIHVYTYTYIHKHVIYPELWKTLNLYAYFSASRSWEAQGNEYSADGYGDTALRYLSGSFTLPSAM